MVEVGDGVRCEVTGEVPEEERERRLSAARGTFLEHSEKHTNKAVSLPKHETFTYESMHGVLLNKNVSVYIKGGSMILTLTIF